VNRIVAAEKGIESIFESMQSICTIILSLVESSCMQIRAEEQDDEDKLDISLMGRKDQGETN